VDHALKSWIAIAINDVVRISNIISTDFLMKFQNFGTFEICSVGSSKIRMGEKKLENLKNLKSPTFEIFEIFEI
jgi:hypothetical protein